MASIMLNKIALVSLKLRWLLNGKVTHYSDAEMLKAVVTWGLVISNIIYPVFLAVAGPVFLVLSLYPWTDKTFGS